MRLRGTRRPGTDSKRTRADTRRDSWIEVVRDGRRRSLAFRLVLISCFLGLLDRAHLASYQLDNSVRVARCGRALQSVKELVAKSGRKPDEFVLHSFRIGGASARATEGQTVGTSDTARREVHVRRV